MKLFASAITAATLTVTPAAAEVVSATDSAFVLRLEAAVAAEPLETWRLLLAPAQWWDPRHTYSGDAANLYLDGGATGCFCEKLPHQLEGVRMGSVEHMHVIHVDPGKVLRLRGGLGPLQGEAVVGTLTMTLKPVEGGTRVLWEYVVSGYMRQGGVALAPLVDQVMSQQLTRLAAKAGPLPGGDPPAAPEQAPTEAAPQ